MNCRSLFSRIALYVAFLVLQSGCGLFTSLDLNSGSVEIQAEAVEEGESLQLKIVFDSALPEDREFRYQQVSETAIEGENYVGGTGVFTVSKGSVEHALDLQTIEKGFSDSEEKFFKVLIFDGSNNLVAEKRVTIKRRPQFRQITKLNPLRPDPFTHIDMGAYILFVKFTPETGHELWRSDGTVLGTMLLKDICPGSCSSGPRSFVKIGAEAYFVVRPSAASADVKIFKTDGTANGTALAFEISAVTNSASTTTESLRDFDTCDPVMPTVCGGRRFLIANSNRFFFLTYNSADNPNYYRIYSSQGAAGTTNLYAQQDDYPHTMRIFNQRLFVSQEDELFLWDGNAGGGGLTIIQPSGGASCWGQMLYAQVGTRLFTSCYDLGVNSRRIVRVNPDFSYVSVSVPSIQSMSPFSGSESLFYTRFNGMSREVLVTNGTTVGTVLFSSLTAFPNILGNIDGLTIFSANTDLYVTDGTVPGTLLVTSFTAQPSLLGVIGGKGYFKVGDQVWSTDFTGPGTAQVLSPDGEPFLGAAALRSNPTSLVLRATTASRGEELWTIDVAHQVRLVSEIRPGAESSHPGAIFSLFGSDFFTLADDQGSALMSLVLSPAVPARSVLSGWGTGVSETVHATFAANGNLYWTQETRANTSALREFKWALGVRTIAGIDTVTAQRKRIVGIHSGKALLEGYYPSSFLQGPEGLIVDLVSGVKTALTGTGLFPTGAVSSMPNGLLYSSRASGEFFNVEPHFFNSQDMSTTRLSDIVAGSNGSNPVFLGQLAGFTYFIAGASGARELYRTDGTPAGTVSIVAINSTEDAKIGVMGGKLYFVATTAAEGREIWVTDGTSVGTAVVVDLNPGVGHGIVSTDRTVVYNNKIYFHGNDNVAGGELWVTDGTAIGTSLVKDICAGACTSNLTHFQVMGSSLYFWEFVANPVSQTLSMVWKSDGSEIGTVMLKDLRPLAMIGSPVATSQSSIFLVYDPAQTFIPSTVWRLRPALHPEPTLVPGYDGMEPSLLGSYDDSVVVLDRAGDGMRALYLAR